MDDYQELVKLRRLEQAIRADERFQRADPALKRSDIHKALSAIDRLRENGGWREGT